MRALPAVTSTLTTTSTTIFKYRPLESRILREFGTVEAFEKAVNLQIKPFLSGECPDLLMADARRASFALRLTDIEQDALFNPEIFFGEIREADSAEIRQKYELLMKMPAGLSRDTSQRAENSKRSNSMNENLQIFKYNDSEVKTVIRDGELWWLLKDVCDILELSDVSMTAQRLDEDEKAKITIYPREVKIDKVGLLKFAELTQARFVSAFPGKQAREFLFVNESGLYNVILRSDKPEAKAFKRWVTHEVLPAIRKTGAYNSRAEPEDDVSNLVQSILDAQKRTQKLEAKIALSAALDTATYKKNNLQKLYETRVPLQELVTLTGVSRTHLTRCARRAGWTKIGVRTLLDGAQILILLEALKTPSPANVISTLINRTP